MQLQSQGPDTSAPSARIIAWLGTAAVMAMAVWLSYRDGGYFTREFLMAAIAGWTLAGLIVIARWDGLELPRASVVPLAMLTAIMFFTGSSMAWSVSPNSSLQEFSRVAIYLAVFAAVLTGPRTRSSVRQTAALFVTLGAALALFALMAKISPSYSEDYSYAGGRLMGSLGYWNALAIFMVMAMLPGLWFTALPSIRSVWKIAATVALSLMGLTLFFTLSRGGIFIGALAVCAYLVFAPRRLGMLLSLASAFIPAAALAWFTYASLPSLHAAEEGARIDASEGRQFALLLLAAVAGAALMKAAALFLPDGMPPTRNSRIFIAAFWCLVLLAAAGSLISQQGRISNWANSSSRNDGAQATQSGDLSIETRGVGRLASTSDQRTELWRIGIDNFMEHPVLGTGAATYRFANLRLQSGVGLARDPHSLWIRFLSDQGIAGFALLLGLVGSLVLALARPFWKHPALRHDGLYLSLLIACSAWLADSSLEWNWEMPVMTLVFFLLAGLALRLGAAGNAEDSVALARASAGDGVTVPVWLRMGIMGAAMVLTLIFLALLASVSFADRARDSLDAGNLDGAMTDASRARKLNRFATEPLLIQSDIARARGDYVAARGWILAAIDLEPERSTLYRDLALIEFYDLRMTDAGIGSLSRALDLDPQFRDLHLLMHRLKADAETYESTGEMPPERPLGR